MENLLDLIVDYLVKVGAITVSQVFILLGPGLILALIMYYISEILRKQSVSIFGHDFWVYFTFIGTVIHEIGHAIFAIIFGHRLTDVKLFSPNSVSGTLGSVSHSYDDRNLYHLIGNFFIGIGPIILGSIVIFYSAKYLIGDYLFLPMSDLHIDPSILSSFDNIWMFIKEVYSNASRVFSSLFEIENFRNWKFYFFIYIIFAVGTHVKLSASDIEGAWKGFIALVGLIFGINLISMWIGDLSTKYVNLISQSYSFFYAIMTFTIILSVLFIILLTVIILIRGAINR